MAETLEGHAESWDHFKGMIFGDFFQFGSRKRGAFWFRGMADADWRLESSFDRSFRGIDVQQKDNIEKSLLYEFRKSCENDDELRSICNDDDRMIALAQHSGLPTRLLDWSESPYVAAFFAFQHAFSAFSNEIATGQNENVAVWMLNPFHTAWSSNQGVQLISVPAWGNIRLYNQQGHFTRLATFHSSLDAYVNDYPANEGLLARISIPMSEARIAMADLDLMGINFDSIYPGIEGRARAAKTRVLLSML